LTKLASNLLQALFQFPGALDGVQVIGANLKAIHLAEDRRAFREVCESLGCDVPRSAIIRTVEECEAFAKEVGFPFILRPSFTLGGTGQSFVFKEEELMVFVVSFVEVIEFVVKVVVLIVLVENFVFVIVLLVIFVVFIVFVV
jgi:carbamoylphosphate synthase large subunit